MLELTEAQRKAVAGGEAVRLRENGLEYVVLRADLFDKLTYDDSPWPDEERDLLAAEGDAMLDDDMAVEDPAP